ncbi:MAG: sodium:proton antiporter [Pirellulales bacterium]
MHDAPAAPTSHAGPAPSRWPMLVIAVVVAAYAAASLMGYPQHGRDLLVQSQAAHAGGHANLPHAVEPAHAAEPVAPPLTTVIPFAVLLAAIAILPLTPVVSHWWEHNSSKLLVAGLLAAVTLSFYLHSHRHPIDLHFPAHALVQPAADGPSWPTMGAVLANAILAEYIPFITLLFALYVITGGVRIEGDLEATPTVNAAFLAVGGLAASFIGTTGAAMLLVRPLLETNRERKHVAHTLVFFIFVVCNCGGLLLPIGDPPLFLGYLQGVDFLWTMSLWKQWLFTNGLLLAIYWLWDSFFAHPRETRADLVRDRVLTRSLRFSGLWPNVLLMAGVIAAVAMLDPSKPVPGTAWHPWIYLRETVLVALVGLSLLLGPTDVRRRNGFTYGAILEVAALFVGIFICMQPALDLLHVHGDSLGLTSPQAFFWATGGLSSVLDNAPTYLVFFEAAGIEPADGLSAEESRLLAAVSLGAVFLGAMTYIGNGPNFMVKAIAEQSGVKMPSFFGYIMYSVGVLLPIFALMAWIFV